MSTPRDYTRWNRAGLSRVRYVDGNAAVFLEHLRARLHEAFPEWAAVQPSEPLPADENERKAALEVNYQADPHDMLWQLTRAFARACHILGETLDAYANEAWLGTATQWEHVRRLTATLDYAPHPPASAYTPVALMIKTGLSGRVQAGLQMRHTPAEGGPPLVFETLADLEVDAALNVLRVRDHDRNPEPLTGTRLTLPGRLDQLKTGEPLVLEDRTSGRLSAHLIQGVEHVRQDGVESTVISFTPPVGRSDRFSLGDTLVHVGPKDRLHPLGPRTEGARVGRALHLASAPEGLAAGDIVAIGRPDAKPVFRRIKAVEADRLLFHEALGELDLARATLVKPIPVPIARMGGGGRVVQADGSEQRVLYVAGDWGWLAGRWLTDIRHAVSGGREREYLPLYECIKARYFPINTPSETEPGRTHPLAGYTALTLSWHPGRDRAAEGPDLGLDNPQTLYSIPLSPGPWHPDSFLQKSRAGRLVEPLVVELPKHTSAGDVAVLVHGGNLAWARLRHVEVDQEAARARLTSVSGWQERGGGVYYLSGSRVYSHFAQRLRPLDAQRNNTPLRGTRLDLGMLPHALTEGRALILDNGRTALHTRVLEVHDDGGRPWILVADAPPEGSTAANLSIYGNVVLAGHGETQAVKILGSGDASRNGQRFLLDVGDVSFVADATQPTGVRADVRVSVAGEVWTQVANLADSGPGDPHYQVRQIEDGNLWLAFGDGRHGRRLPTGSNNISVVYRRGVGAAGNIGARCLRQPARPHALVEAVVQPIPAGGGGERESVTAMRENAAAALLALERAVALEDFTNLARSHAAIAQARAFLLPPGLGQRDRVEVVVVPAGGGPLTAAVRAGLQSYLQAHALPGVSVVIRAYDPVHFSLRVRLRVRLDAYDGRVVRETVWSALVSAFSRERRALGQSLYRGEVYAVVDAAPGVENSDVEIVLDAAATAALRRISRDPGGVILSVHPYERQSVHLDDARPGLEIEVEPYRP